MSGEDFSEWLRNKYAFDKIDYWIDKYRDYMILYDMFQDEIYLTKAKGIGIEMYLYYKKALTVEDLVIT